VGKSAVTRKKKQFLNWKALKHFRIDVKTLKRMQIAKKQLQVLKKTNMDVYNLDNLHL